MIPAQLIVDDIIDLVNKNELIVGRVEYLGINPEGQQTSAFVYSGGKVNVGDEIIVLSQ